MIKKLHIYWVTVVLAALCAMSMTSCTFSNLEIQAEISVKTSQLTADKGSIFVSVVSNSEWTLSIQGETSAADWATINTTSGFGSKSNIVLSYDENTTGKERTLNIVLACGDVWSKCQVTQFAEKRLPTGDSSNDDSDSNDAAQPDNSQVKPDGMDLTMHKWLELPEMKPGGDLTYYSHSFEMNGNTYRNYSFGYSKKDFLAIWVAYPLCSMYTNGNNKSSAWRDNPYVENEYEPNYSNSFGYSQGYERGHQIANADRKCSKEANAQTYYYTNATLQDEHFNGPIWGALEANMRNAANTADTLYVVTGCVVGTNPKYITDKSGHRVPVPSAYFKAALRYHEATTINKWLGAGFYLEHDASKYSGITSSEAMSISSLEQKLGIKFFVNLPEKVGEATAKTIKAQNPSAYPTVWGL